MQVIFIHHSCFLVEVDEKVLIFDWFGGERVASFHFHGVIPEYEPDTPIYVFASHKHQDHFDMDVLHWAGKYTNIHYIFSKDCKMSPHFLEKHGFSVGKGHGGSASGSDIREKITYVSAGGKYEVAGLHIETLRSTDTGVAFYVETNGVSFFHAGDLNNWKWEGAGDLVNGMMEANYKAQIRRLSGKKINLAFVPLDPRLEKYQFLGIEYFLSHTDADYVFPMHMWQKYAGIWELKKRISNAAMAERVVEIGRENQVFEIFENT